MIILCVHEGKKKLFRIKFKGKTKEVEACPACEDIIKSSTLCEVLS
ncbi:MAG: hypothetical protein O6761_02995 [Thaumarchaeota archaeon]|nr:hypothetical protein [Nitrososphaerota archaeon]